MSRKTAKRVNLGISIYYGISCLLAAFGGLVAVGVWLYKVFTGSSEFSWGTFATIVILTSIMAGLGYSILRVGFEHSEE